MYKVQNIPDAILREIDYEYGNIFYGEIIIKKSGFRPVDITYVKSKRHNETEDEKEIRNG